MSTPQDPLAIGAKLTPPRHTGATVTRSNLCAPFEKRPLLPLYIIRAPAGFGKSTLAIQWLDQFELPSAWFSIDSDDNDPVRWFRHFLAAIRTVEPKLGISITEELNATTSEQVHSLIPDLLNAVTGSSQTIVVVLDDYHFIQNDYIHNLFQQILTYQPHQLSLVITSRSEPPLTLSKLRAKQLIHEVTGDDLRFSHSEASELLNDIACLNLSEEDLLVLEKRTEGWAAGLHLAAISLKKNSDKKQFILEFNSKNTHILSYLSKQILNNLDNETKSFLLKTSILKRLNGSLCKAVTDIPNCSDLLVRLEQTNIFLFSLDSKQFWYRYHHLFSELLQNLLLREHPEIVDQLYLKASIWCSDNDHPHDAMHYALEYASRSGAHEGYHQACKILDRYTSELLARGETLTLTNWINRIPQSYFYSDPNLTIKYFVIMHLFQEGLPETEIAKLEQRIRTDADCSELQQFTKGALLFLKAFYLLEQRDIDAAIGLASESLKLLQEALGPKLLIAAGLYTKGRIEISQAYFKEVLDDAYSLEYHIVTCSCICGHGQTLVKQNRLQCAHDFVISNITRLKESGWYETLHDRCVLNFLLGEIAYKQSNYRVALRFFYRAKLEAQKSYAVTIYDILVKSVDSYRAAMCWHLSHHQKAKNILKERCSLDSKSPRLPVFDSPSLIAARWLLHACDTEPAEAWLNRRDLSTDNEPEPNKKDDYLLLAWLLFKQDKLDKLEQLASKLEILAEQDGRVDAQLEVLVLKALMLHKQGQINPSIENLQRALEIADIGEYIQIFIDEKIALKPIFSIFKQRIKNNRHAEKIVTLIENFPKSASSADIDSTRPDTTIFGKAELKVLKLLVLGLSNKEIANELGISNNTVKTHLKNIFDKLDVKNRQQATLIASEMDL